MSRYRTYSRTGILDLAVPGSSVPRDLGGAPVSEMGACRWTQTNWLGDSPDSTSRAAYATVDDRLYILVRKRGLFEDYSPDAQASQCFAL